MARKPRLHVPGALYHVMLRGNGGQSIFFADDDWEHFEALVAEGVGRFGHQIHGYCWMSNHIHLAVQVVEVPLSRIMQNLAFRYTRWVNKGYREEFHRGTADGRFLGDEDFVAKTLSQVRERSPLRVEPERITEVVCAHRRIEAGQLATADRSRAGSEARTLSAYLAVELGAASLTSMGQRFNRDVATMSNRVRQFRRRLAEDKALAEEIRMLQSELIEIRKA